MKQRTSVLYTLATIFAGVLLTGLIYFAQQKTLNAFEKNLPYVTLGDQVKNDITSAHLWLEEYLSGDRSLKFNKDVMPLMDSSVVKLERALVSAQTNFTAPEEQALPMLIERNIGELKTLIAQAKHRNASEDQPHTSGTKLDQDFDASYIEMMGSLEELVSFTNQQVEEELEEMITFRYIGIFIVVLIFTILASGIYLIQSRNEKNEEQNKNQLNKELNRIEFLTSFVHGIAQGNHEQELEYYEEGDELADALISMRDQLKSTAEVEKRRNWSTQGLAELGSLLRADQYEGSELYDRLVAFMVKYTNSTQGALYIVEGEDEEQYLQMVACYAYDRKKFMDQKIEIGDGLVGQCALEQESIFLTDIPQDYVNITSGLGEANPSAVLIVPLKINEEIQGVIELASFGVYEKYQLEFVEKGGESIASAISSVRTAERTQQLLQESQMFTEQMSAQEEEMRQNMEELQATQEEVSRKEKEYLKKIEALEQALESK